jgi:hypothetical protein
LRAAQAGIAARQGFAARVGGQPIAHGAAQFLEPQAAIGGRESFHFCEAAAHERAHALVVFLLMVVEASGDLDDALEEGFVGLGSREPDRFPGLVGVPELAGIELAEAAGKGGALIVSGHRLGRMRHRRPALSYRAAGG